MMRKLKLLITGPLDDSLETLSTKLDQLNKSKNGPFDVCISQGPMKLLKDACSNSNSSSSIHLPLPVYYLPTTDNNDDNQSIISNSLNDNNEQIIGVNNLNLLIGCDMTRIVVEGAGELFVGHVPKYVHELESFDFLESQLYKKLNDGVCDILLTQNLPQNVMQIVKTQDQEKFKSSHVIQDPKFLTVITKAAPRYLVCIDENAPSYTFIPYVNQQVQNSPLTRAMLLSKFQGVKVPPEKKYIHALNISHADVPASGLESSPLCPFVMNERALEEDETEVLQRSKSNGGLSQAQVDALMASEDAHTQQFRYNIKKRQHSSVSLTDNKVLHISGVGLTNELRGDVLVAFRDYGVQKILLPPNTNYGFVEFADHSSAEKCLQQNPHGVSLASGLSLVLRWSKRGSLGGTDAGGAVSKKRRLTESEASNSDSLFFSCRIPDCAQFSFNDVLEYMRGLAEGVLEDSLNTDDSQPKISAKDEPALAVKIRETLSKTSSFGFLSFASHAAATMAVQVLTNSMDGGAFVAIDKVTDNIMKDIVVQGGAVLHWAHANANDDDYVQNYRYSRDERTDCWFCLASPSCVQHLIVDIRDKCYLAMPRGALDPYHTLIIPVAHDDEAKIGAMCRGGETAQAIAEYKEDLRGFANKILKKQMFIFERAIQTKGGYHSHIQCIPLDSLEAQNVYSTMMKKAASMGFALNEVNSDLGLTSLVPDEAIGYFYAEIPNLVNPDESPKRLVKIIHEGESTRIPLQFGREVAVAVTNKPQELSHWKACVEDEEKEKQMADEFKNSFAEFLKGNS